MFYASHVLCMNSVNLIVKPVNEESSQSGFLIFYFFFNNTQKCEVHSAQRQSVESPDIF